MSLTEVQNVTSKVLEDCLNIAIGLEERVYGMQPRAVTDTGSMNKAQHAPGLAELAMSNRSRAIRLAEMLQGLHGKL